MPNILEFHNLCDTKFVQKKKHTHQVMTPRQNHECITISDLALQTQAVMKISVVKSRIWPPGDFWTLLCV